MAARELNPQSLSTSSNEPDAESSDAAANAGRAEGLSYKFQRLRERLRDAVVSGEFAGKLPGERQLAKRFHVNAKTLSKALTDLAAEGVLDRSIGRGTYVKGSAPAPSTAGRWLLLSDEPAAAAVAGADTIIGHLMRANADAHVVASSAVSDMRPSFLNQFSA